MGIMRTLTINGAKYDVIPVVPAESVTLLAGAWVGEAGKYSQVVEVAGATPHTKVNLQPTPEQLIEFQYKVLAFVAENDGGVVTVYAIGDKPTGDHTIQITLKEVDCTGKIRGNAVGTTMPRPDLNQTDPESADYVKGREVIVRSVNGAAPDENGNVAVAIENPVDVVDNYYTSDPGKALSANMGSVLKKEIQGVSDDCMRNYKKCVRLVNGASPDESGNVVVVAVVTDEQIATAVDEYMANNTVNVAVEAPVFDLAAMGLPTIVVNGGFVEVNADLTEIAVSLAAGPVKLLAMTSVDGDEEMTTYIGTGFYKPTDNTWQVVSRQFYNGGVITGMINFVLSANRIEAQSFKEQVAVTDEHINELIDAKIGAIENASY